MRPTWSLLRPIGRGPQDPPNPFATGIVVIRYHTITRYDQKIHRKSGRMIPMDVREFRNRIRHPLYMVVPMYGCEYRDCNSPDLPSIAIMCGAAPLLGF